MEIANAVPTANKVRSSLGGVSKTSTAPREIARVPKADNGTPSTPRKKANRKVPRIFSGCELSEMKFEPINYVVPGYIAEGLTLFAGASKLGKSWLCLEIGLAIAEGAMCLGGVKCQQGDVLYLALEDNERRLVSRHRKLRQHARVPDRFNVAFKWPRANEGGVDEIREWILEHRDARLVIVDVLAMFRPTTRSKDQTHYDADYLAIKELQSLAMETGVAIVVVHHTRKSRAETDPFEEVSGTMGLSGAADTTIILRRDHNGCTLYGRGRDIEEIETAVQFDKPTCRWRSLGNAYDARLTAPRAKILSVLIKATKPMGPKDIQKASHMKRNNIDALLPKMVTAGEVVKIGRGQYTHPERSDLIPGSSSTPDKIGKKIRYGDPEAWANA